MRTIVDHTVMFLLDEPGDVLPMRGGGQARLDGVTVHLLTGRRPMVSAGGIRCRKDGGADRRMGRVSVPVELPDPGVWIERARQAVRDTEG